MDFRKFNRYTDPKQRGKALTGNLKGLWRYRVGSYRIVAEIKNDILLILG
mgnify:FL=1